MIDRLTSRSIPPVRQDVYVRRASAGLRLNGELDGWLPAPDLICRKVVMKTGAEGAQAFLDVVMKDGSIESFEAALTRYRCDDQIKVCMRPIGDAGFEQPRDQLHLAHRFDVIFEGVLVRQKFTGQGRGETADEASHYMARGMHWLDQWDTDHLIFGRWAGTDNYDESPTYFETTTMMMPAVFNFRGRPNMHPTFRSSLIVPSSGEQILCGLWTDDENPAGAFWTVGKAIGAILHAKVYGLTKVLSRNIDVEYFLSQALAASSDADRLTQHKGLDATLPEVDVQGMGPLEAIDAVCKASGFEMALVTTDVIGFEEEDEAINADRRYQLRIWRRGTGNGNQRTIKLAKRGSTYATAEQLHQANNSDAINGMADADGIINEPIAFANQYVEATFELKPLWNPDEMSDDTGEVFGAKPETADLADAGTYWSKHVAGGSEYEFYRHVGRHWGLDDRGGFDGYETGDIAAYAHGESAFDFVGHLQLDGDANPAKGYWSRDTPIVWMNRTRRALPLMNPTALGAGMKYLVEVSEDAGSTWVRYAGQVRSLQDYFGIELPIKNLGKFSIAAETDAGASDSWWQKILDGDLRVRVTCCVLADGGPRFLAKRQPTSGTAYKRTEAMPVEYDELLVPNGSLNPFNTDSFWHRYVGTKLNAQPGRLDHPLGEHEPIAPAAQRRQAKLEDVQWSVNAATVVMDRDAYQLGDLVVGVEGRNVSFASGRAGERRYPSIVGITINLGAGDQSIELDLDDHRFGRGS